MRCPHPAAEYLARSLSAFHVFLTAVCLTLASNVERYLTLIGLLGVAFVFLWATFTGICLSTEMPWWWTALEGPHEFLVGTVIFSWSTPSNRKRIDLRSKDWIDPVTVTAEHEGTLKPPCESDAKQNISE